MTWTVVTADNFPGGIGDIADAVVEEKIWIVVTGTLLILPVIFLANPVVSVNPGASNKLTTALSQPNVTYDGSEALSIFASEARNENAL